MVLGGLALVLALLIARTRFPDVDDEEVVEDSGESGWHLLLQRHLVLGVVTQFLYVGAQIGTWSYFIQYVQSYAVCRSGLPDLC